MSGEGEELLEVSAGGGTLSAKEHSAHANTTNHQLQISFSPIQPSSKIKKTICSRTIFNWNEGEESLVTGYQIQDVLGNGTFPFIDALF